MKYLLSLVLLFIILVAPNAQVLPLTGNTQQNGQYTPVGPINRSGKIYVYNTTTKIYDAITPDSLIDINAGSSSPIFTKAKNGQQWRDSLKSIQYTKVGFKRWKKDVCYTVDTSEYINASGDTISRADVWKNPYISVVSGQTVDFVNRNGAWVPQKGFLNVKDFGALGNNSNDDITALQAAVNYAATNNLKIIVPTGVYKTSAPLLITTNNINIEGESTPSFNGTSSIGSVINYTGTDCAIKVGNGISVNGNFIENTRIKNIRIELTQTCNMGLWVWLSLNATFENISIYGNEGTGKIGLRVSGGVHNVYNKIEVSGYGRTGQTNYALFLDKGLLVELGYGNQPATTTTFSNCYFHYCNNGAYIFYYTKFENCVFEANYLGLLYYGGGISNLDKCWFEANQSLDIYFDPLVVYITNCHFNSYTRNNFFSAGGGLLKLVISNSYFASSDANPTIFSQSSGGNIFNTAATDNVIIDFASNQYPANCTVGSQYNESPTKYIKIDYSYKYTPNEILTNKTAVLTPTSQFVGINKTTPIYKLDIDANTSSTGNPLRLAGLQAGATTDSIVTSQAGVLKRMDLPTLSATLSQSGNTSIAVLATGATGTATITFSPTFATVPNIVVSPNVNVGCYITAVSTTNATITCTNNTVGALTPSAIYWIARK